MKDYDDSAKENYIRIGFIVAAVLIIALFLVIMPSMKYNKAVKSFENGNIAEAISLFEELDGYKDSEVQIDNYYISVYGEDFYNMIKNAEIGDVVTVGYFEQGTVPNSKEKVEWYVIEKDGLKLRLLSKYGLEFLRADEAYNCNYWFSEVQSSTVALIDWLDKPLIVPSECEATEEAISTAPNGTEFRRESKECSWWTVHDGELMPYPFHIGSGAEITGINGSDVAAVRPCIWIDLKRCLYKNE